MTKKSKIRKPPWLRRNLPRGSEYEAVRNLIARAELHTVCQEAKCPNMWECFSNRTSTFMILGSQCTRNCRFCNVRSGTPLPLDPGEPFRVARASRDLGLGYVVVTSVTRDDLDDGGAGYFAETIRAIRELLPGKTGIEVLIPDFKGSLNSLKTVLAARPDVLNHNIETIASLYPMVRPEADYQQSLNLMKRAFQIDCTIPVKSGIMVGLGETIEQIKKTMNDLLSHKCTILTLGQYLQPSRDHLDVVKYYTPDEFENLKEIALTLGFSSVASGPFVRSSYQAQQLCSNVFNQVSVT